MNASFDAISTRLQEDSVVFFELLDQLRSYASTALALHASIAGDIQYMKGVGWHAAAVLVAWCITAPTRARSARFWALVGKASVAPHCAHSYHLCLTLTASLRDVLGQPRLASRWSSGSS